MNPTLSTTIDILATDDIEDDLAIFGGITRILDRKGKQVQHQTATQPPSNFQSNPLLKSPFSFAHLQPQSHQGSSSGSSPCSSSVELDNPQVHPSFFLTQLEGQTSAHLTPQSTNLEYGGMSQSMAGLSSNPGINALGSERYFNTTSMQQQVHQRPGPGRGYHNAPLSNTHALGGYPNRYGYHGNPSTTSSDNTSHTMLPVNIGSVPMGGRTAEVDDTGPGYVPTYTFRTSDEMNASMDPAGAVGLSSGMDTGWLTFMRDCGIMDVREDR
jgi:hypothetical protein